MSFFLLLQRSTTSAKNDNFNIHLQIFNYLLNCLSARENKSSFLIYPTSVACLFNEIERTEFSPLCRRITTIVSLLELLNTVIGKGIDQFGSYVGESRQ